MSSVTLMAFGGGVDSTAMLILALAGEITRPTAVVFSDPGAEFPHTYANLDVAEAACDVAGIPFVRIHKTDRHGDRMTITDMMRRNGTVPLMPGGPHVCSLKFKGEVLQRWAENAYPDADFEWLVGIEADETKRAARFSPPPGARHTFTYPLMRLGFVREDCERLIRESEWPVEVLKSSCVFCPYMKAAEIEELFRDHPEAWALADEMERSFEATSARKHRAWIDAGRPLVGAKRPRAPRGMWRRDSWADGARLFARTKMSTQEIAARLSQVTALTIGATD